MKELTLKPAKEYLTGSDGLIRYIGNSAAQSTGFESLDDALDGGLYPGLYIVGAISSLGKTTFVSQMADMIASSGRDVIFFSLEMSKFEMISKSISRVTRSLDKDNAMTTRDILKMNIRSHETYQKAIDVFNDYSSRLYIVEGVGDIGVMDTSADGIPKQGIASIVKNFIKEKNNGIDPTPERPYLEPPVIIIDYLQILAPYDYRASDKQNTDKAVLELKRLSRDLNTPILAISSFNRENYTEPVSMASFKESGAIEYGSDCLIALQYSGMDYTEEDLTGRDKDRKKRVHNLIREQEQRARKGQSVDVQVKILKQRNAYKSSFCIDFIPKFNIFVDKADWQTVEENPFESNQETIKPDVIL